MRKLLIVLASVFACAGVQGQDIHFSQFNDNPLHINPAYTGMFDGLFRLNVNYRNQWTVMGAPYKTMSAAFDMPLLYQPHRAHIGVGAFVYSDQAGDSKFGTMQALVSASGIVPINDQSNFSLGIQGGYSQRKATIDGLKWESQYVNGAYDPNAAANEANALASFPFVDFSAGGAFQWRNATGNLDGKDITEVNAGLSGYHLNKPEQSFHSGGGVRLDMRLVAHAQVRYDFPRTRWSLRPSGYYMQQGAAHEILIGSMVRYRIKNGTKITNFFSESGVALGCHYRVGDAIVPQFYYDLGDLYLGFSYDVNISRYSQVSKMNGGFEVTLRYANLNGALYKNKR